MKRKFRIKPFRLTIFGLRFRWGKYLFDETESHRNPEFEVGSEYQFNRGRWRYGRAGEDIVAGTLVESDLAGRMAPALDPSTIEITSELIWGCVKAAREVDQYGTNVLGWTEVKVKKGRYCWLKQPPLGAEFKKEEGQG